MLQTCSPSPLPKPMLQSGSRKLLPKVAAESCSLNYVPIPKLVPKAAPQSCSCSQSGSPQLLPKDVPQSTAAKPLPQSCYASNLFTKAAPQSYSPKRLLKAAPQSCYRKLPPKVASQRSLIPKAAPQSCGFQSCCSKLPRKAAPQSCSFFPRLLHKAFSQSRSPKLLSKAAPNICSPKLLKLSQSCFLKLLIPKAVVLQSNCSSMLLQSRKVAPHNCSPKLFSKVATESRVPKKLPKTARTG